MPSKRKHSKKGQLPEGLRAYQAKQRAAKKASASKHSAGTKPVSKGKSKAIASGVKPVIVEVKVAKAPAVKKSSSRKHKKSGSSKCKKNGFYARYWYESKMTGRKKPCVPPRAVRQKIGPVEVCIKPEQPCASRNRNYSTGVRAQQYERVGKDHRMKSIQKRNDPVRIVIKPVIKRSSLKMK